jgi:hypothetical protein
VTGPVAEPLLDDDRAVDPAKVNALLAVHHPGVTVTAVDVLDETEGSASRLRLRLTYAPGADGGLPATMFLKRNLARFNFPTEVYTVRVQGYGDKGPARVAP